MGCNFVALRVVFWLPVKCLLLVGCILFGEESNLLGSVFGSYQVFFVFSLWSQWNTTQPFTDCNIDINKVFLCGFYKVKRLGFEKE